MLIPFPSATTSRSSSDTSDDPSSARCAWLRLANKLQRLAAAEPRLGPELERIVDAALEELRNVNESAGMVSMQGAMLNLAIAAVVLVAASGARLVVR